MAQRHKAATEHEYVLRIGQQTNVRTNQPMTVISLETGRAFAAFQYRLTVEEILNGREIHYRVLGLAAPKLDLPTAGPAKFVRSYDNLKGTYTLTVEGIDGETAVCSFKVTSKAVTLADAPKHSFMKIIIAS